MWETKGKLWGRVGETNKETNIALFQLSTAFGTTLKTESGTTLSEIFNSPKATDEEIRAIFNFG